MSSNPVHALYILSPGHSGSTLLNLIVGSHSRAIAVSELTHLPKNIARNETCTCGATIQSCPHWSNVAQLLIRSLRIDIMTEPQRLELGFMGSPEGASRGSWCYRMAWRLRRTIVYASLRTGIPLPDFMQRKFAKGITHRWAVYDAVRESSGATLIVDASKGYLPGIATYLARPTNTRFILLTRDGRAVFNSNIKRGFDRKYALRVWHNYYRRGLPLIARHADSRHVLRVRYEDLASNPEREARRICEFCELDYEANMLDTASKTQHITSGNNMRFRSNKEISPDMSWRKQLSAADQEFFHRKAGIINHELGYE